MRRASMLGSSEHFVATPEAHSDTHHALARTRPLRRHWRGAPVGALTAAAHVSASSGALVASDKGNDEADVANNTVNNAAPDSGLPDAPESVADRDCDDGVSCQDDACVEEVGACLNVSNHAACLAGELCHLAEDRQPLQPRPAPWIPEHFMGARHRSPLPVTPHHPLQQ